MFRQVKRQRNNAQGENGRRQRRSTADTSEKNRTTCSEVQRHQRRARTDAAGRSSSFTSTY